MGDLWARGAASSSRDETAGCPKHGTTVQKVRRAGDAGAAAVEFALVATLLITLVFGIVDFGWLLNRTTLVNNAVREGARAAVVTRSAADAVDAATSALTAVGIQTTADPAVLDKARITATCAKTSGSCDPHATTGATAPVSGDLLAVTIELRHRWITPIGSSFGSSFLVSRTSKMRVE
jgi:Flp pilus assembly protein TadG